MKHRRWLIAASVALAALTLGGLVWAGGNLDVVWAADSTTAPRNVRAYIARGVVTSVQQDEIQIETAEDDTVTLLIGDSTAMWVPGEPLTRTVTLEVGAPVLALGRPQRSDGIERALSARLVVVVSDHELPRVLIHGQVLVVTRQTIVVNTQRGERAITVLPRTRLWSAKGRLDSLRDLRPGEQIVALGQPTEYGQWIAGALLTLGLEPLERPGLRGEVINVDAEGGTLIVETDRQEITVVTDENTRYRIAGLEDPSLDDIQIGDQIIATGRFEEGSQTTFQARAIGVVPSTTQVQP
jgi:RNase P/RNase MRP subunit p29